MIDNRCIINTGNFSDISFYLLPCHKSQSKKLSIPTYINRTTSRCRLTEIFCCMFRFVTLRERMCNPNDADGYPQGIGHTDIVHVAGAICGLMRYRHPDLVLLLQVGTYCLGILSWLENETF